MTDKPKHFIVYGAGISLDLVEKISASTKATEIPTSQGNYDGEKGMPFVEFWPRVSGFNEQQIIANKSGLKGSVVTIVQSTGIPYANNFEYAKIAADNAKRFGAKLVHVIFPFRDLREDKAYENRGTSVMNPKDARELAVAGVDYVTFLAPHSQAGVDQYAQVFGKNISVVDMAEIMIPVLKERFGKDAQNLVNGAPDGWNKPNDQAFGCAVKIAREFHGDDYERHMFGIEKERIAPGESHPLKFIGDVKGRIVVSADDMFSGGGTSVHSAQLADAHGATEVYVAAPHGIFVKGLAPFLSAHNRAGGLLINQIITTNTLPVEQSIAQARQQFPNVKDRILVADVSPFVIREMQKVFERREQVARDARYINFTSKAVWR